MTDVRRAVGSGPSAISQPYGRTTFKSEIAASIGRSERRGASRAAIEVGTKEAAQSHRPRLGPSGPMSLRARVLEATSPKAVQSAAALARAASSAARGEVLERAPVQRDTAPYETVPFHQVTPMGSEPKRKTPKKAGKSGKRGAKSGALSAKPTESPDVERLAAAWGDLPPEVRAAIGVLVGATRRQGIAETSSELRPFFERGEWPSA